jgi:thioredoxin 1
MKHALCTLLVIMSTVAFGQIKSVYFDGSYDDAIRLAKKEKKTLVLNFTANWCGPCQKMESETFSDEDFSRFSKANCVFYNVDVDKPENKDIVQLFEIKVFPYMVVTNTKKEVLQKFKGSFSANYLLKEFEKTFAENNIYVRSPNEGVFVSY